jgi:DNA polymerase IV
MDRHQWQLVSHNIGMSSQASDTNRESPSSTGAVMPRCVAHVDMDAFYASVEQQKRPELAGKPLAVGGRHHQAGTRPTRGVITTASYEARRFGVRSAMSVHEALQRCPELVLVPVDFAAYRAMSQRFKQALLALAPVMEDRGIDEVYLELTDHLAGRSAPDMAKALQQAVFEATGLTCSIGIAPNKLLAKIASDMQKPAGISLLDPSNLQQRLWTLPVRKLYGVGPRAEDRLVGLGIATIGQIASFGLLALQEVFGQRYGLWLHESANGIDTRPVVTHSDPVSSSRETTFDRLLHPRQDWTIIAKTLEQLCQRLAQDLQRKDWLAKSVGVKVRFDDLRIVSRDVALRVPSNGFEPLRRAAFEALARAPVERRLRLLGVKASGLVASIEQPVLADQKPLADTTARPKCSLNGSRTRHSSQLDLL